MGVKEILEFVKVEHTLFSLPFVLIGYVLADAEYGSDSLDLLWILLAAVGARGLAMVLNRIIDSDIDAENPRTASRHLPSGLMSKQTAWGLAIAFLVTLAFSAWMLNEVALQMVWLPVLAFMIYPYTKRVTWICHLWLGLCLGLAPAGAWVALAADVHGWGAITGVDGNFLWYPEIFFISMGVALWIAAFDINYARMDVNVDREQGIKSFPSAFGDRMTTSMSVALTMSWALCFVLTGLNEAIDGGDVYSLWIPVVVVMALVNIVVMTKGAQTSMGSEEEMRGFQQTLFNTSVLTGWALLVSLVLAGVM